MQRPLWGQHIQQYAEASPGYWCAVIYNSTSYWRTGGKTRNQMSINCSTFCRWSLGQKRNNQQFKIAWRIWWLYLEPMNKNSQGRKHGVLLSCSVTLMHLHLKKRKKEKVSNHWIACNSACLHAKPEGEVEAIGIGKELKSAISSQH